MDNQLNFTKITPTTYFDSVQNKNVVVNVTSLSQTNTNPLTTGKPEFTTGSRIITFVGKFIF